MIRQNPINIECEVKEILDYDPNEGIIGRVVKSYVNPQYLKDGKLDWGKIHPIIWTTGGDFHYYKLGTRISQKKLRKRRLNEKSQEKGTDSCRRLQVRGQRQMSKLAATISNLKKNGSS